MAVYKPFPHYVDFTDFTPVIPEIYWNVYSSEQRIRALCCEWVKLVAYVDGMAETVNNQYAIIKDMQERLPELVNEEVLAEIQRLVNSGEFKRLVEQAIADFEAEIRGDITTLNTGLSNEATTRANADGALGARIDNEEDARISADNALSNRITNLETEYAVFIGDSYLRGTGTTAGASGGNGFNSIGNGWGKYLAQILNMAEDNIYCIGAGSAGFVHVGTNGGGIGLTFEGMLDKAISEMTTAQRNATKYVVLVGGINDGADITSTAVNSFMTKLRNNFKNAKKYVGTNGGRWEAAYNRRTLSIEDNNTYAIMQGYSTAAGAAFMPLWKRFVFQDTLFNDDNIHLNDNGYGILGRQIYACMCGGEVVRAAGLNVWYDITPDTGNTINATRALKLDNEMNVTLCPRRLTYNGSNITSPTTLTTIGSIPRNLAPINSMQTVCLVQTPARDSSTVEGYYPATLSFARFNITTDGDLQVGCGFQMRNNSSSTGVPTYPGFNWVVPAGSNIYIPAMSWSISN